MGDLLPHPVPLDLWDPVGFASKASPEKKASSLVAEINNGRLAMLGIFGFLSESISQAACQPFPPSSSRTLVTTWPRCNRSTTFKLSHMHKAVLFTASVSSCL